VAAQSDSAEYGAIASSDGAREGSAGEVGRSNSAFDLLGQLHFVDAWRVAQYHGAIERSGYARGEAEAGRCLRLLALPTSMIAGFLLEGNCIPT
jgi:hypothetical protein